MFLYNTMQQRSSITMKENEETICRGRHNAKPKVLVRSHAIREEASPPRECSSPSPTHHISPSIKVIPSTEHSPSVVLSPSLSRVNSPLCISPTSTLVPSPTARHSPQNVGGEGEEIPNISMPLTNNNKVEKSSHSNNRKKVLCDCSSQTCARCLSQERNFNNNLTNVNSNTLCVNRGVGTKGKLRQQSSSQGSFEESSSNSPCLSRDSSSEQYTDTSGADLEVFIPETINRNAKDRAFMLRIEQELVSLAKDKSKTHYKFPPMSSYQRMLVHRCAAYFGMDHNIESSGKCVVVNKTKNTRIPEIEFKEHIKEDLVFSEEPRRSILKRDSNSIEDYNFKSPDRQYSLENRRSKSFEEREEEYAKVRRRIFNREELCMMRHMHDGSVEDFEWAEIPWSSTDSDNSSRFRLQLPEHSRRLKLTKVLSEEVGETSRPYVAKSYSFGGYAGVLNRGDSVVSTHSAGPRLLTKQDSAASSVSWRLSPSSSGYKSQSQMSESITPSPTSTPNQTIDSGRNDDVSSSEKDTSTDSRIVWAVTDIQRVPKGSIIINPQTGEALKNEDGTLYLYDPNNPPISLVNSTGKPPPSPKKLATSHPSPKKLFHKLSPSHKSHLTTSSTSPTLPYSPPISQLQQPRTLQFVGDNIVNPPQFPIFGNPYTNHDSMFYQQPCIVYSSPYTVPISPQYEGRLEPQPMADPNTTYYVNVPDPNIPSAQYQQSNSYWNQPPITFYQNPQGPPVSNPQPPRFTLNQPNLVSSFQNYLPPPPPPQPTSNPDFVPVFPQQPMQLIYPQQQPSSQHTQYSNQPNLIFNHPPTQNHSLYPTSVIFPQGQPVPPYPQNTSTPNNSQFSSHLTQDQNLMHLTQNMCQLGFNQPSYVVNKHFDMRPKTCTPKNPITKFGNSPKNFILGSSQSSTGTNSPAATVVAGYCPQNMSGGLYRTPSETPPNQYAYAPGFGMAPMLLRQISNVRANTPGTARSSRSPTPASDISYFERPRIPPPSLYHGMPYVLPTDTRLIPGRTQSNTYRQSPPVKQQQNINPALDNKSHKSRKSK